MWLLFKNISHVFIWFRPFLQTLSGLTSGRWRPPPPLCRSTITTSHTSLAYTVRAFISPSPCSLAWCLRMFTVALCVWCFWRPTGFPSHSSGVRCVQRPRDADPNLQGRKVQRNGSDGLWPVCPMQSSQSVAALWRWRGQALPPFYVLCRVCHLKICILCTVDVSDIDPLPACDLLLATAGRSGLWSQRSSGQVCVQSLMLLPKPTTVSHSVNKNWPNHGPCVRFTQRFAAQ